jgi:hypothetical protein
VCELDDNDHHLARPAPCFFNTKSGVGASFLNGTKIWRAGGALLCDKGLGECSGVEDSEDEELEEVLEEREIPLVLVNDDDDAESDKHEGRADGSCARLSE